MLQEQLPQQTEQPQQSPSVPARSNRRWIVLGIAGCAMLLCAALVVGFGATFLANRLAGPVLPPTVEAVQVPVTLIPDQPALAATEPVLVNPAAVPTVTVAQAANTMGDPNAPVKITEYADFQCPYCMRFWQETEPQIVEQYVKTGKVF